MRGAARFVAALLLGLAACVFQATELPSPVVACSCVAPMPTLEESVANGDVSVVVGTIGAALPDRTAIGVETWFHGDEPADVIWVRGGTNMSSSCDISIGGGERWLLVLYGSRNAPGWDGLYGLSMCDRNGRLGTPHGDALVAEATQLFGPGQQPAEREPEPAQPIDLTPFLGEGLLWAMATSAIGLLFLGGIALIAKRRRNS